MKHLLATVALTVPLAAHAQSFRVKLTQPLPYYKVLSDTATVPSARQQYPTGSKLDVVRIINNRWYAVTLVTEHDVAAYYVRRSALASAIPSILARQPPRPQ